MEPDLLKETAQELNRSAKLIRNLVADLINLRRSLLKAYSGLSKLAEARTLPLSPPQPLPPVPPEPSQSQTTVTPTIPSTPTTVEQVVPVAVREVAVEEGMAAFAKSLLERIKSDPHVSNIVARLIELRERIEKEVTYHPVLSEIKIMVSKLQSMPGDNVLGVEELENVLKKLLDWVARLS